MFCSGALIFLAAEPGALQVLLQSPKPKVIKSQSLLVPSLGCFWGIAVPFDLGAVIAVVNFRMSNVLAASFIPWFMAK